MPRATRVLRAAERRDTSAVDTLILPHAQRQAQKGFLFGVKGTCVELDFAEAGLKFPRVITSVHCRFF